MIRTLDQESQSHDSTRALLGNFEIAVRLDAMAERLDAQNANPFRIKAYRTAAANIRALKRPVHEIIAEEGRRGLATLPGIGKSLSRALERLMRTGRIEPRSRLSGMSDTERKLATVAGIGPKTAARIVDGLGIDSLAELEAAAYDGRLAQVPGIGRKRLRAVRETLAGRARLPRAIAGVRTAPGDAAGQPPVGELLDIDEEFRNKAAADRLLRVAPRRFNPTGDAWLPILHTRRDDRHYTALFSNTARAHELGTVHDWVVIYRDAPEGEGQWTVVTSRFGKLKGRRIVRGRESECGEHYARFDDDRADASHPQEPEL